MALQTLKLATFCVMSLPGGARVVLVAARNRCSKFFLTSESNNFGGFPQKCVMLSSGCPSVLIPLDCEAVGEFLGLFGDDVLSFCEEPAAETITLQVRRRDGGLVPADVGGFKFKLPALRFRLTPAACRALLEARPALSSAEVRAWLLADRPAPTAGGYAVLGQALLGRAGLVTVQAADYMAVLDTIGTTFDHVGLMRWLLEHAPPLPDECHSLGDDKVPPTPPQRGFVYIDDGA